MTFEQIVQAEFPVSPDIIYLNHAAVAPWPLRTCQAVTQFAQENTKYGATNYPRWNKVESDLRKKLATLIHIPSADDIALVKNTSEALSIIAHGIDWQPGDNIIISDEEFPSNRIVWESLLERGITLTQVNLHNPDISAEQALINAITPATRLLSISSAQYSSGYCVNLEKIGQACKANNIIYCVDAIQTLGALEFDAQAIKADCVMADAHKWMLGPEGVALFYCTPALRQQLKLHEYGWHMIEDMYNYTAKTWQVAHSARMFECGSPNMLGIHALHASLSLLLEIGMDNVSHAVLENAEYLFKLIKGNSKLECLSSSETGRYAGIVCFKHKNIDNTTLFKYLTDNRIVCAQRGAGVRFSPHLYTSKDNLTRAVECAASA